MSINHIGKKIREARLNASMSQKDLGDILYVSEKAVSAYESGRNVPPLRIIQKIAEKTDTPMSFFTGDEKNVQVKITALLKNIESQLTQVKKLLEKNDSGV